MVSRTPSRTAFVIVATSGILSVTPVASAAPQGEQRDNLAMLAADKGASLANTASAMPRVAGFYTLQVGDATGALRVSFVQNANELTATWMRPTGQVYGRGTYRWDPVTGSFKGTSTTRSECFADDGQRGTAMILVKEELYVMNEGELRDRWTKPLAADCRLGLVEVFKWVDQMWLATDKDWKPLRSRKEPPEILVGAH